MSADDIRYLNAQNVNSVNTLDRGDADLAVIAVYEGQVIEGLRVNIVSSLLGETGWWAEGWGEVET
jgi:hypothetical protein